jgi:hypothetical protein
MQYILSSIHKNVAAVAASREQSQDRVVPSKVHHFELKGIARRS